MKSKKKSKAVSVDIEDLYAVKIKSLWQAVKQEPLSFWTITAYFFFEYVRPQGIFPAIAFIPWAQICLLAAIFGAVTDRTVKWMPCVENKHLLVFLSIVLLSAALAFKPHIAWETISIIINWVLIYFLVITIVNTEKRFYLFLFAYFIFNFKMSQHGFVAWASRGFSFTQWGLVGPQGWFNNSGEYAIQMQIFACVSTAYVLALNDKWSRLKKWFLYLMPFTAIMTVLGASSRGSQLGLLAIGLLLMVRLKAGFKIFIGLAIFMLLAYSIMPEEQIQRFSNMGDDSTSLTRFAYWAYGWEVIKDNLFLGVGYDNWLEYARFTMPDGIYDGRIQLPHNIYIEIAAESGLLGFFGFLLLLIYALVINGRTRKMALELNHKLFYFLTYGFSMGLVGYLVAGTFVTVFYYPFFWVQIAFIVALHNVTKFKFEQEGNGVVLNKALSCSRKSTGRYSKRLHSK